MSNEPTAGNICTKCKVGRLGVVETRPAQIFGAASIRRRRECGTCKDRTTTYEITVDQAEQFQELQKTMYMIGRVLKREGVT